MHRAQGEGGIFGYGCCKTVTRRWLSGLRGERNRARVITHVRVGQDYRHAFGS